MVKNLVITLIFITAVLSLTGCGSLTSLMDGVGKEETVPIETAPESSAEQEQQEIGESASGLTGSTIAEVEEESKNTTYTVKMTADGFGPDKLYIKVGDTVVWKNVRSGTINKAMIIGVRECKEVRSGFLKPGESFSWTFNKPVTCTIADGVMTREESKIFVEE